MTAKERSPDDFRQTAPATAGLTAAFFLLLLFNVLHHECWRDELAAWLDAHESRSLVELAWNIRYTGHPHLWHLLLYALTRVSDQPFSMQLLNVAIATTSAYVVLRFAPFPLAWRGLFVFGYFPFFEYGTISRSYGLVPLLLASACAADARRRPLLVGACLALLAQTSVYGTIVALAFAAARPSSGIVLVTLAASALAAWQMVPPPGGGFAVRWFFTLEPWRLVAVLERPWLALMPLPQPIDQFWGTNVLDPWPRLEAALSVVLVVVPALRWRRTPAAAIFWTLACTGFLAFAYVKFAGSIRHYGHLFLAFGAAAWLARSDALATGDRWTRRLVPAWLACHVAAALWASVTDFRLPFSASAAVARVLRAPELASLPIAGDRDTSAVAVSALLGRSLYYPSTRSFGTFVPWTDERRELTRQEVVERIDADLVPRHERFVVILNRYFQPRPCGYREIGRFDRTIVPTEHYRVYVVDSRERSACE